MSVSMSTSKLVHVNRTCTRSFFYSLFMSCSFCMDMDMDMDKDTGTYMTKNYHFNTYKLFLKGLSSEICLAENGINR